MKKEKFNVTGMTCTACSAHVEKAVSRLEGVGRFVIGLAADVKIIDSPALEEYVRNYVNNYLIN